MNDSLSFRDVERLSAYLDGQLSRVEAARLEARLTTDPALRAVLEDLRQARSLLRRAPRRRAPRNFALSPRMAGLRPPVPRGVPLLSWASALAALLFFCTFSGNLVGRLALNAAAPAAAPLPAMGGGYGGGPAEAEEAAPMLAAPASEEAANSARLAEATPETQIGEAEAPAGEQTAVAEEPVIPPQAKRAPLPRWPLAWLVLAALFGGAALLLRWLSRRRFRRKHFR